MNMTKENETGDLPDRFYECIDYLEELDAGKGSMLAEAAECIRELIGMLGVAEQALEDRKRQPKIKPAQPPYAKDRRYYQTREYLYSQDPEGHTYNHLPLSVGDAIADKE